MRWHFRRSVKPPFSFQRQRYLKALNQKIASNALKRLYPEIIDLNALKQSMVPSPA